MRREFTHKFGNLQLLQFGLMTGIDKDLAVEGRFLENDGG